MPNKVVHLIAVIISFGAPIALHDTALGSITVGTILTALYLWASHIINPTITVATARLGGYKG